MPGRYYIKNIRALLTEGFTDKELRRLCYDVSEFKPVHNQLAENTGKAEIIDRLIEFAEQKLQVETLLAQAKERNPGRYQQHQPYYPVSSQKRAGISKDDQTGVQVANLNLETGSELMQDLDSLKGELVQHQRNLNLLREQAAIFAAGETPLHILNQIEAEKTAIQAVEERLSELKKNTN